MKAMIRVMLALLTVPAHAAEQAKPVKMPIYHDCRLSEDIVNGRTVKRTVCQNEEGEWIVVPPPEKKKVLPAPVPALAMTNAKPVKKPVYHDCRPSQDVVNGRAVWNTVCQNEAGDWVEVPERKKAQP
jgi:hypothetical protein